MGNKGYGWSVWLMTKETGLNSTHKDTHIYIEYSKDSTDIDIHI